MFRDRSNEARPEGVAAIAVLVSGNTRIGILFSVTTTDRRQLNIVRNGGAVHFGDIAQNRWDDAALASERERTGTVGRFQWKVVIDFREIGIALSQELLCNNRASEDQCKNNAKHFWDFRL